MTIILNDPAAVAEALRVRRAAAGLTQRQLANLADCSYSQLCNIEAGCVPRRSEVLDRIHEALSVAEQEVVP